MSKMQPICLKKEFFSMTILTDDESEQKKVVPKMFYKHQNRQKYDLKNQFSIAF